MKATRINCKQNSHIKATARTNSLIDKRKGIPDQAANLLAGKRAYQGTVWRKNCYETADLLNIIGARGFLSFFCTDFCIFSRIASPASRNCSFFSAATF